MSRAGFFGHDEWDVIDVENRVTETTYNGIFTDGDNGVVGIINVEKFFVKVGDIVGISKFACADMRVLADPRGDVQFVGWRANIEWLFGKFGMMVLLGRVNCLLEG